MKEQKGNEGNPFTFITLYDRITRGGHKVKLFLHMAVTFRSFGLKVTPIFAFHLRQ